MKKVLLTSLVAAMICGAANASDGGVYYETETFTNSVSYNTVEYANNDYVAPRAVVRPARPCNTCGQPVRVKTHSEIIDHYQVYQPVTVYKPAGTYTTRRIVANKPCGCGK